MPELPDSAVLLRLRMRQLLLVRQLDVERHLGRAAAALGMSQPAATKLLHQIEETLGVSLFTRGPKGVQPTDRGEVIVRYARTLFSEFGAAREELTALGSGLSGSLRIGSVPGAVPPLVAPALTEYKRRHPRVHVSVTVDTSNVIVQQLDRGEVDIVLGRLTEEHTHGSYDIHPMLDEALVVVVRQGHPMLQMGAVSLGELALAAWVMQPQGTPQRTRVDAAMLEAGIAGPLNITESASTIVTTALLEISEMVAVMPESLAQHYGRLGVLRTLPLSMPIRVPPIYLITLQGRELPPSAVRFRQLLAGL